MADWLHIFDTSRFSESNARISVEQRKAKKLDEDDPTTVEEEFHKFFGANGLLPIFTNEHKMKQTIPVSFIQAQEVIKDGSRLNRIAKEFADYLIIANDNQMYEEATTTVLYGTNTLQQLFKKMELYMSEINEWINNPKWKRNTWNIVWYTKEIR